MYPLLTTLVGLSTVGLIMLARAARTAPEGFEDAAGFHAHNPGDLVAPTPLEANFKFEDLLFLDKQLASQPWS